MTSVAIHTFSSRLKRIPSRSRCALVLKEMRDLMSPRSFNVVFDRGNYSHKRPLELIAECVDVFTIRKCRFPVVPRQRFGRHTDQLGGRHLSYELPDQEIRLRRGPPAEMRRKPIRLSHEV